MTWLTFELARHPDIQRKVQACQGYSDRHAFGVMYCSCEKEEVDHFFRCLNGRDPTYQDVGHRAA